MIELVGLSLPALSKVVMEGGFPKFRAKQIMDYIYQRHIFSMDEIGNFYQKTATPILLTLSCKILPHERCNLGAKEFDRLENLLMRKRSQR